MTMTKITPELLDALMSPEASRRGQAETFFQGIPPAERVGGLVHLIISQQQQQQQPNAGLAAVLLRRDILRLSSNDTIVLEAALSPLLESFMQQQYQITIRNSIGYCLAEICAVLAMLSPSPQDSEQVMARILQTISAAVS